jgi:hypothetical protein
MSALRKAHPSHVATGEASAALDPRAVERLLLLCGLDGRKLLAVSPVGIFLRS